MGISRLLYHGLYPNQSNVSPGHPMTKNNLSVLARSRKEKQTKGKGVFSQFHARSLAG
jgi:hypothetical protein